MFILDSLFVGGLRFVLEKVDDVAGRELNDPERWRAIRALRKTASPAVDDTSRSVIRLVLSLVEFIRQLLERQAVRCADVGSHLAASVRGGDTCRRLSRL